MAKILGPRPHYPCRYTRDPAFHVWRSTPVEGWHVCQGCGVVGNCTACFAADGLPMNRAAVPMLCPTHQAQADAMHPAHLSSQV